MDITAYIRNKVRIVNLNVKRFNFPYARKVSSFRIGVPFVCVATMFLSSFWCVGNFFKEYEAKKKESSFQGS